MEIFNYLYSLYFTTVQWINIEALYLLSVPIHLFQLNNTPNISGIQSLPHLYVPQNNLKIRYSMLKHRFWDFLLDETNSHESFMFSKNGGF